MPFLALAIPVLHSSGAWIAYAGSGYLAGTLSTTWVGAFILGNASLLSGLGLVSAAGVAGAAGLLTSLGAGAALTAGNALTAVGLGGLASWLGIAPVATFLGLTPFGWAVVGATTVGAGLLALLTRKAMRRLNEERSKGGLEAISAIGIVKEVREFEAQSKLDLFEQISREDPDVLISDDKSEVTISGQVFTIGRLQYVVNNDGSEEIVFVSRMGKRSRVYLVKPAGTVFLPT